MDFVHKWIKSQSRTSLTNEFEGLHPAELGKIVSAATDAYKERTILRHPDFGKAIDHAQNTHRSKETHVDEQAGEAIRPTQTGYYWMRGPMGWATDFPDRIIKVREEQGRLCVVDNGEMHFLDDGFVKDAKFYGPLENPFVD